MKFLKNWIIDLILSIILLTFGILLLIPDIYSYIVSIFVGALLIIYFVLAIVPKFKKMTSASAEWVTWIIIESILIIALAVMAIINQQTNVDLGFITLELNHIVGLVLIIEGTIGLIKLCNLIYVSNLTYRPKKWAKYINIALVILGTVVCTLSITAKNIAYIVAALCFACFIVTLTCMIQILVKKNKTSKRK